MPTLFNVTNSKETGGHIVLNNRKLLLSYKPVSIEKVTIKQYDENSTEAVKSGTQTELIQSHNALELKNIKIEVVKSGDSIVDSAGSVLVVDSEFIVGEQNSNIFNMSGASSQYFAGQKNRLEIDGLVLDIPSMKGEYIISRNNGTDILINDIEVDATSTRPTPALSLLSGSVGLADGTTVINIKGVFNGVTKMQNFTDSTKPSVLQVTGGTFDFDPTNFVNTELFEVVFDTEVQKWTVQEN